jgi:hypothetical protein
MSLRSRLIRSLVGSHRFWKFLLVSTGGWIGWLWWFERKAQFLFRRGWRTFVSLGALCGRLSSDAFGLEGMPAA